MNWLFEPLGMYLRDLGWRDILEITVFSSTIYALQLWLRYDKQKSLLNYWYAYCGTWMIAYVLNLSTINYALLIMLPAAITMFVLIHQRTLQKSYIALRSITPARIQPDDWLDILMQTALSAMNHHKQFWCVIEHQDALATFLTAPLPLQATIKKELLTLLLENVTLDNEKYVWITTQGEIRGINASWTTHADNINLPTELPTWHQDALFFTSITDALVLHADCAKRTFTIIIKGTALENTTAQNAHRYIKHHQMSVTPTTTQGGTIHGSYRIRTGSTQQPRS